MADYDWTFGKTRTVHRTDDGEFVIAENNQWLDGVFATEAEAWDAFDGGALRARLAALTDWVERAQPVIDRAWSNLASDFRASPDFGHADADEIATELGPLLRELDVLRAVLDSVPEGE